MKNLIILDAHILLWSLIKPEEQIPIREYYYEFNYSKLAANKTQKPTEKQRNNNQSQKNLNSLSIQKVANNFLKN